MKDIPAFTTENGAAGLTLQEIPYTGRGYIKIWDSCTPQALLDECVAFCRMVGAEEIFACGHPVVEQYPFYTAIVQMRCSIDSLEDTDAALWPVQQDTLGKWQQIYNEKAVRTPNAAWMSDARCAAMLKDGGGYFVHRGNDLLGIGLVCGDRIDWVAACQKGAGSEVVRALAHACTGDTITLEVASANEKAMKLYESLGFVAVSELSRWHQIRKHG